jgi:hypothetical protein
MLGYRTDIFAICTEVARSHLDTTKDLYEEAVRKSDQYIGTKSQYK